jgi:hypothetical protein
MNIMSRQTLRHNMKKKRNISDNSLSNTIDLEYVIFEMNRLLLIRLLLVTEYQTAMKSIRLAKSVSTKSALAFGPLLLSTVKFPEDTTYVVIFRYIASTDF